MFCSDRGRRGGCGRTFAIFFASVLPRHSLTTALWSDLLRAILAGTAVKTAWENLRSCFSLEAAYRLVRRTRARLAFLRPLLDRTIASPPSTQSDPLLQTLEHFQLIFDAEPDLATAFQIRFQRPLLG
ncbi:MAG: hypothetical protein ABI273_01480 [Lacunisphaera sp.]